MVTLTTFLHRQNFAQLSVTVQPIARQRRHPLGPTCQQQAVGALQPPGVSNADGGLQGRRVLQWNTDISIRARREPVQLEPSSLQVLLLRGRCALLRRLVERSGLLRRPLGGHLVSAIRSGTVPPASHPRLQGQSTPAWPPEHRAEPGRAAQRQRHGAGQSAARRHQLGARPRLHPAAHVPSVHCQLGMCVLFHILFFLRNFPEMFCCCQ